MSSFLCFICHSTVNSDTKEETREKYKEVIGMNMCPNSHMCHICCHVLSKLFLFKSVCLKRSMEYPVLFSEKGTLNLQRNDIELQTICHEDSCGYHHHRNINSKTYNFTYQHNDNYVKFDDERTDFEDYFNINDEEQNLHELMHIVKAVDTTDHVHHEDFQYDNQEISPIYSLRIDSNVTNTKEYIVSSEIKAINSPILDSEPTNYEEETSVDQNDRIDDDNFVIKEENNITDDVNQEGGTNTEKPEKIKHKAKKNLFEKLVLTLEQQKVELDGKRKEKKYLEAEFKCHNCALGFLFKDTYQTHMMRHEESNGEHVCAVCSLRFARASVLRAHRAMHAERYLCRCGAAVAGRRRGAHAQRCRRSHACVHCLLCGIKLVSGSALQQHLKRYHHSGASNRSYSCSTCGESCNNQAAVRTHMIKHINRKFKCDQCVSTFSSPYTLNQHKKKHESREQKLFHCAACSTSYSSRKSLLAHLRNSMNHQQSVYECPVCSRTCPNQRSLTLHIESIHSADKHYACPSCTSRYTNRKSLVRHMATHGAPREPKIAVCQICGGSFKGNSKLNRHLREVCKRDKLEEELAQLYDHQLLHPG